jgi:hypothetical protein
MRVTGLLGLANPDDPRRNAGDGRPRLDVVHDDRVRADLNMVTDVS